MESPNAPTPHDFFTPAWLKLPDPQHSKKSSSSVSPSSQSAEASVKRFSHNTCHRKELNNSPNNLSNGSLDSRDRLSSNEDSSQHYLSSRHNSFGSEQQFNKPNLQSIGNNVNGFRNKKYIDSSGRPPFRSVGYREKSVGYHSNQIPKLNRNIDTFEPDFIAIKKSLNKSSDYSLDNESNDKNVVKEENCNVFNQEFPSLVNEVNSGQNDNSGFHSAWSKTATKSKVLSTSKNCQLIHSSVANFDNIENTKTDANVATSSKLGITSAKYLNLSLMAKGKGGIMKENAIYNRIQPMLTKTIAHQTTPSMEILVKNPKKRSNKSDFLNSIRNDQNKDKELFEDNNRFEEKLEKLEISPKSRNKLENSESETNSGQIKYSTNFGIDVKNAQNINNQYFSQQSNEDMGVLSSSLEAEHRLLMELGWKAEPDEDDPSYAPLTEDEVKEFKDLINARNGFKRNTTSNTTMLSNQTIHLNSSPKKWPTSDDLDEESTSSSDDD